MTNPVLRILQTCLSPSWGGLEIQAFEISQQMRARGHVVWIACPTASRLQRQAGESNIPVLELSSSKYFHPSDIIQLSRFINEVHVDIVHCHASKDLSTVVPAVKLSKRAVPVILSKRIGSGISKKDIFHRFMYANVSLVFAISEFVHHNVLATTTITPERVITIHDAVDTDRFSLKNVDRSRLRKEFRIDDGTLLIGFVGRFSPGKGHEEFLHAAGSLQKKFRHLHFLVVGEASHGEEEYRNKIMALCTSLGLDDVITFSGYRSDIPDVMAAFDIFAFPSHAESFGVGLIEAMAMERPVVSTRKDGILDILVDGETGIFVNPKDAADLTAALTRLIEDPSLRERIGKAARQRVEALFDQKKQIQKMEQIYFELVRSHNHPA